MDNDVIGWLFTFLGGTGLLGAILRGHGTQREHTARIAALEKLGEASGRKLDRASEAIAGLTSSVGTLSAHVERVAAGVDRVHERIDEMRERGRVGP